MGRFLVLLSLFVLFGFSGSAIEKNINDSKWTKPMDTLQSQIDVPDTLAEVTGILDQLQQLWKKLSNSFDGLVLKQKNNESEESKSIKLVAPTEQPFSIHNVELGETKTEIEAITGPAKRVSLNEYGTDWYTYHNNYQQFFMVMYDKNNQATGLYTDQDLISSKSGIKMGTPKETVRETLGEPLTKLQKGFIIYQFEKDRDYDMYLVDDVYVTIFYDKHEGNTVTALQLISKNMEEHKSDYYTEASPALKEGFEYQLFDLTNASRVNHQLPILTWDQHVRETARKHSSDMAKNDYFSHTNLKGQSPFDRMKEDQIIFQLAGENLAYGQLSSIFAHEGLMNSLGHRENILRNGYVYLGVGVAFNDKSQPYYTENFYAK
ncbi:CAP domain-containing protein [Neobacillus dielmonensis]|uniref:CAP domain-containing protein n=1 Tax=Neobacillus dielmonensis TaxID=1347369 RepID=UPI000B0E782C|nr:CAP domain-containing protein [Neobacillus dielmonensis]